MRSVAFDTKAEAVVCVGREDRGGALCKQERADFGGQDLRRFARALRDEVQAGSALGVRADRAAALRAPERRPAGPPDPKQLNGRLAGARGALADPVPDSSSGGLLLCQFGRDALVNRKEKGS